jgi:hypothetical protein
MSNQMLEVLSSISKDVETLQETNNSWINSRFEAINRLKNDYSGKVGERFIAKLCEIYNIPFLYKEDQVKQQDGTYDINIKNKLIEIKIARQGNAKQGKTKQRKLGSWQHDSLRNYGCDYFMFIDVTPNNFYISIFPMFDFKKKHIIFGCKPHLRKDTSGQYKFDFGSNTIKNGIKHGLTLEVNNATTDEQIYNFVNNNII